MANNKLTIDIALKILISSFLALCLYGYSQFAFADESTSKDQAKSSRHEVELIRDKDYKCVQCHKDAKETLLKSHGDNAHEILGKELNCTNCHNGIGPDHREGAPVVTKFSSAQSKSGTDKVHLNPEMILKANQQCTGCHQPEYLRKDSWTHDVHAKNLTCSNCHTVHGSKQKVLSLDRKEKIQMCVDCHSDFNMTKEEEK